MESKNIQAQILGFEVQQYEDNKLYKLKTSQGVFNIYELKKDKTPSVAFTFLSQRGFGVNKVFDFSYYEKPNSNNGTSKYVTNVREINGSNALNSSTQAPYSVSTPNNENNYVPTPQGQNKPQNVDWDKISWGKCKHAFLVEAFKAANESCNKSLTPEEMSTIEKGAEAWADMSMRKLSDLPVQEQVNDIPVDQLFPEETPPMPTE